ncbi:hypothetical protein [Streptomyces chartreusis]|uniref:vWA-MoxR associated conflict system protein n=1 Tax=Streptomyces chartreusis TaxID=1969 RepID=UPI0033BE0559
MSDTTNPPRHVLVVGAQCAGGARLEGLENAARNLHAALVNPSLGGCVDRSTDSLLIATRPGHNQVHDAVTRAAEAARRDGGPLVLALLGHGEGGRGTPLHFVTSGQLNMPDLDNVNVPTLLGKTANHPGLSGLIAIVDTCLSGGAVPDTPVITAGREGGGVRFSLLFAASAVGNAYNLQLSTELTRLIEDGLPRSGDFLTVDDELLGELRKRIRGQQPGRSVFDGGPYHGNVLWLARNRAVPFGPGLGPVASQAIRNAVQRIDRHAQLLSQDQLDAWLRQHERTPDVGSTDSVSHVRDVRADLEVGRRTLHLVDQEFGPDLTEDGLRLAGLLAGLPQSVVRRDPAPLMRDMIEHAVHRMRAADGTHRVLAHLVAATAYVTRHGDRPPKQVIAWAQDLHLTEVISSRLRELNHAPHGEDPLRLVLVFAEGVDERIVRVDSWLIFGRAVFEGPSCDCAPDGGTDEALAAAVGWAGKWANVAGRPLRHIDIAAPTLVLLDTPAEERTVRRQMLGVTYTVTTRWSGLLTPPPGTSVDDLLQVGEQLLACLDDSGCAGPRWLPAEKLVTVQRLQEHLRNHAFGQSVWALASLPETDWETVAQELLEHTPALIWPRRTTAGDAQAVEASVGKHWRSLPQQLAHAYRQQLSGTGQGHDADLGPLAGLRAVWHDKDWQAFCRRRAMRVVRAPDESTLEEWE